MLNEKKKVVPKLRQEVKVDIFTSNDIKIDYTGKFQDFTARYIINAIINIISVISGRSFLFHRCPLFRQWLCGKAACGLKRILCGVLVKRTPGKHGYVH